MLGLCFPIAVLALVGAENVCFLDSPWEWDLFSGLFLVGWKGCLSFEDVGRLSKESPLCVGIMCARRFSGHGFERLLLVNGIGITFLTPLTKAMAHLPCTVIAASRSRRW